MICYIIVPCYVVLEASNSVQYFASMNYPAKYPNYQDCRWQIYASIGHYVVVTFEDFHLHPSRYCSENSFDYVQLSQSWRHIATLCSTDGLNKTYRSFARRMAVTFRSSRFSKTFKGFNASYKQGVFNLHLELLVL